jgi:cytochrome c peroxidase
VLVYERAMLATPAAPARCIDAVSSPLLAEGGAAVAVAFLPDGRLVAQTRAPARIVFEGVAPAVGPAIDLAEVDTFDTGHALFHGRASGGIACASCHPEGGDDAHTWRFSEIGARRTQTMRGGLLDTAPFHWDGDMADFSTLVHSVFEGRMGGAIHHPDEITAFARWMDALPALPRPAPLDADAVERGRALFHDPTVACATCHAGENLTTSVTVDVGTGRALQVPTLLGIAYRAPYMHDGCAPTLRARLDDAACSGGERHGHTAHLSDAERDDLVAYLRSL